MARKKNHKRKKKGHPLFGTIAADKNAYMLTAKEGGLILLAALAASGAGAAMGKHSLVAGVPLTLVGIHKKNKYLIAAGLGLTLSNGFQKPGSARTGGSTQGVEGFDLKQISLDAKDRVRTFFENFKGKLYLVPASVEGMGNDDEPVTYFVNPYKGTGAIDTSAIERVQEQIAAMNTNVSGLNEVDREF